MQTSCAPSPSTRKHAAEGQLDLCLPQRVACEVWYHRNARSNQKKNPRCDGRCMREGRQESAGATVGTGVRAGAGAYGRYRELCTREGRHGHAARGRVRGPVHARRVRGPVHARRVQGPAHARRSAGAGGRERTGHHERSNRCEHSSRFGMRAAAAKRQPSRINARASKPRPPRAGLRPTGRARRARRT